MPEYDYASLAAELGITGRRSGQQLIGRCPLHQDNEPSFSLNLQQGLWTCFAGCGAGAFTQLVQKIYGISVAAAHDWMLQQAALMPVKNPEAAEPEIAPDMRWLHRFQSIGRSVMPQWWFDRGFTWETANTWDIRYDEDMAQIVIPFYSCGKSKNWKENNTGLYALYGTITRNLKSGPKYQNSPGLPRSQHLYGLTASSGEIIYLTEGPLDCLAFAQEDMPSAAILGVRLSDDHIKLLLGFTEICLALDSDESGRAASYEIANRLRSSHGLTSQITEFAYPEGVKDPGEGIGYLAQWAKHRRPAR